MNVKQNGKTLYHIQNLNISSDGYPFDVFIFCDHFPNEEDLRRAFRTEFDGSGYDNMVEDFVSSSEVYAVYAEEL